MTQLLTEKQIAIGVQIIRGGGLVSFRTETVYGLAADAANAMAVKKIFAAKNRPADKPLVMQFASVKDLSAHFPNDVDAAAVKVLKKFKSGLTLVLKNGVAVRIPADKFAQKFLRACKTPLYVTSANTSAQPSPTTWNAVYDDLNKRIDAIFMSGACKIGVESTVVQIIYGKDKPEIKILREGAISAKKFEKFNI